MSNEFKLTQMNGIPFYWNGDGPYFTQRQISDMLSIQMSNVSSCIKRQIRKGLITSEDVKVAVIPSRDGKMYSTKLYPVLTLMNIGFRIASSNELAALHPLIEQILIQGGYVYEHHMDAPTKGILDFWARDVNGVEYIIEGKIETESILKTINQIKGYAAQFDGAISNLILAIPVELATGDLIWQVGQAGISVWGVSGYEPLKKGFKIFDILDQLMDGDAMDILAIEMGKDIIAQKSPFQLKHGEGFLMAGTRHDQPIDNWTD